MIKLGQEKAVYSVLLPEVKKLLTESISEYYIHTADKERLDKFRWNTVGKFKYWVKDIIDLSEFKHAYPINGVTGAIEQWLLDNSGNIQQLPGEYGWAKIQRPWIGDSDTPMESAYISNPFSANGSFHDMHKNIELPTLLDCAFIGTTKKNKIDITPNIKAIAFSFSKGFSVNLFRTGFLFSRDPIPALDVWLGFNYYNYASMNVADKIMDNFAVDYIYNKFRPTQLEICEENDLNPSDCVFLATSTDSKYDHYKRGDGTNRLCLAREYERRGLGSFVL
jgi:hypothetical protein